MDQFFSKSGTACIEIWEMNEIILYSYILYNIPQLKYVYNTIL